MDDLRALEDWAAPLLAQLQPAQQRRLALAIARDLRRSQTARIAAQANPDGSAYEPRKPSLRDRAGGIRKKMFGKIRQARHLKAETTANDASVGFTGRVARIASVHQLGLRDRVRPDGAEYTYPSRELLGFTDAERERIKDLLLRHLDAR